MLGNWPQVACWYFVLVASDRLNRGVVRVSIIFKGRLDCMYFVIKALKVCAKLKISSSRMGGMLPMRRSMESTEV